MQNWKNLLESYSLVDLEKLVTLKRHGKDIAKLEAQRDALIAKLAEVEEKLEAIGFAAFKPEAAIEDAPAKRGRKPGRKAAAEAVEAPEAKPARRGRKPGSGKAAKAKKAGADVIEMADVAAEPPRRPGRKPGRKSASKAAKTPKADAKAAPRRRGGPLLIDEIRAVFAAQPGAELTLDGILSGLMDRGFASAATAVGAKNMINTAIRKAGAEFSRAGRGLYRMA